MNIAPRYIGDPVITKSQSVVDIHHQPSPIDLRIENEYGLTTNKLTTTNTDKSENIAPPNKSIETNKSTVDNNPKKIKASTQSTEKENLAHFAEKLEIKDLIIRDQQVRSHEIAHSTVGGAYTGSPTYFFTTGPDGKKYATKGEVSVDLSIVKDSYRLTIAKMQKVHDAALAPLDPSVKDTRIADKATRIIYQAQSAFLSKEENLTNQYSNQTSNDVFNQTEVLHSEKLAPISLRHSEFSTKTWTAITTPDKILSNIVLIKLSYLKIAEVNKKPTPNLFQTSA